MPARCGHLRDLPGHVEVHRLDDDGVDALGDDVLGLRHLVLGVVLGRLDEHLVAGRLGGLREERDVGVEVAERGLLLEHERDLPGRAGHAFVGRPGLPDSDSDHHRGAAADDSRFAHLVHGLAP